MLHKAQFPKTIKQKDVTKLNCLDIYFLTPSKANWKILIGNEIIQCSQRHQNRTTKHFTTFVVLLLPWNVIPLCGVGVRWFKWEKGLDWGNSDGMGMHRVRWEVFSEGRWCPRCIIRTRCCLEGNLINISSSQLSITHWYYIPLF